MQASEQGPDCAGIVCPQPLRVCIEHLAEQERGTVEDACVGTFVGVAIEALQGLCGLNNQRLRRGS